MNSQDVILGMLMKRSYSGYDIKLSLETLFSYFFDASFGTIYPTLAKMEKEGLISKESVQQEGKPNKNIYTVTDLGRQEFLKFMGSKLSGDAGRSDLLVRLQFGEYVEVHLVEEWFNEAIRLTEEQLAKLHADFEKYDSKMNACQRISIEYGLAMYTFKAEQLKKSLSQLKERTGEKQL